MNIRDLMSSQTVSVAEDESVLFASRLMARTNVGSLPVRNSAGKVCGIVTDRDLLLRCVAAGKSPATTAVGEVMTHELRTVRARDTVQSGVKAMRRWQVRRLPVVGDRGELCGMFSLSDLAAKGDCAPETAECLADICKNIRKW